VVDPRTAAELEATDRVVLRYVRENPNGSTNEIAGVTNAGRNVVGIMPHPERRDAPALGGQDGARVFHSMEARHATQHAVDVRAVDDRTSTRSEEHTSELQSRGHLVCRLLLEKKKKKARTHR